MLTLQGSLLLNVETKTGLILRASIFKESKEVNTHTHIYIYIYVCVRKYLILFVEGDNNPLHEVPLQRIASN